LELELIKTQTLSAAAKLKQAQANVVAFCEGMFDAIVMSKHRLHEMNSSLKWQESIARMTVRMAQRTTLLDAQGFETMASLTCASRLPPR
jgi:hypothetical protein